VHADKPQHDRQPCDVDAQVLLAVRQGDRREFESLVGQWADSLFRLARRIAGSHDVAEEIRQTVLLRILEAPERLPEADRFGPWIRRCVINEAATRARRNDVRRRSLQRLAGDEPAAARPAWENAVESEEAVRLDAALEHMDSESRALLSLRFDEDLTFREIAEVLEQPVSTVKSQFARAIERLKSRMVQGTHAREH
jgi:RNA polymerase sigma-70 factor, ECF subfamily